ncbi:MAG: type II CAAX endopeptidase family protein [Candidatus Krumholzibacteriaceae bacterium]|jgi:membrane protease YdiL (CAAX protease family)
MGTEEQNDHPGTGAPPDPGDTGPQAPPPAAGAPAPLPAGPPPGLLDGVNNYVLLIFAGACLIMHYSLSGLLYFKGWIALSLSLPGIFAIFTPLYLLSQRSAFGFVSEFRLVRPHPGTTAVVILTVASAILPIEAFSGLFERMWPPDADYTSFILSIKPKGPMSFFLIAIGVVLVAAFTEEILFRGFIQRIFQRNMTAPLAIVLAGLIFSLSHFNPPAIPGIAVLGMLFGFIFYRTGNLWNSVAAHALYNLVTLVRLNASSEQELAASRVTMPSPTWTLVSLAVLAFCIWTLVRMPRAAQQ